MHETYINAEMVHSVENTEVQSYENVTLYNGYDTPLSDVEICDVEWVNLSPPCIMSPVCDECHESMTCSCTNGVPTCIDCAVDIVVWIPVHDGLEFRWSGI